MTSNKLSYNIHSQMHPQRGYSAEEETYLFDHLKRLNPPAVLFMDNQSRALHTKQMLPGCSVVVRNWRADDGAFHNNLTPQAFFDLYKDTPKNLILNVLNEPSGYGDLKKLAHWCAQVMDLFGAVGIALVLPNFGEGHPDVDKLADLEELWTALDKWHALHYWGSHEYGTWRGMVFNESGKFDVFPWRVGRFEQFIVPYLKAHGHKIPNVILTEFGCDSAHDGTDKRGWSTVWNEQQYFDQLMLSVNKVYSQPHYVGLCLYCYGNTGKDFTESDWRTFDLSAAKDFHKLLEANARTSVPPPVIAPLPVPTPAPDPIPPILHPPPALPTVKPITREFVAVQMTALRMMLDAWQAIDKLLEAEEHAAA